MIQLRPFKDVQLQWLRLLLLDTDISPRAFQFATYLAVWRYNTDEKKAWPSHSRVCQDLGLKSEKTIQRLIKELNGKWFDIKRGNGLKHSTEYVPTKETHLAAQELRAKEEAGKPDNIVRLKATKGRHSCPISRTKMTHEPGQKCPPKKEKEKTKEKGAYAPDLPEVGQSGNFAQRQWSVECPVRTLLLVSCGDAKKVREWNHWLLANGFPDLSQLPVQGRDANGPGYLMPRRWVPSETKEQDRVRRYISWALRRENWLHAIEQTKPPSTQPEPLTRAQA